MVNIFTLFIIIKKKSRGLIQSLEKDTGETVWCRLRALKWFSSFSFRIFNINIWLFSQEKIKIWKRKQTSQLKQGFLIYIEYKYFAALL